MFRRARRTKCDEAKPSCRKCVKSGLSCEYAFAGGSVRRWVLVDVQTARNPDFNIPGTSNEKRAFDFFSKTTASELSGHFSKDFWAKEVLRVGVSASCLRHAIVALGAVHERFNSGKVMHAMQVRVARDSGYLFALAQYNTAIRELQAYMVKPGCSPKIAVMCCVLFICFESFRGAPATAMIHFKYALYVMQAWRSGSVGSAADLTPETMRYLRGLVSRLGPQLTNVDMLDVNDFGASESDVIKHTGDLFAGLAQLSLNDSPEGKFNSFDEARDELNDILNMELCFFYQVNPLYGEMTPPRAEKLQSMLNSMSTRFAEWETAFNKLWVDSLPTMTPADSHAALLLQMQHKFVRILINCLFKPNVENFTAEQTEELLTNWTPQFREVLMLMENIMAEPASRSGRPATTALSNRQSTFYPEVGVIVPLFFLGLGCRDSYVRRRATELLKRRRRREGTWDSETCWQVLEYIMNASDKNQVRQFLATRYKLYQHFAFMGESI